MRKEVVFLMLLLVLFPLLNAGMNDTQVDEAYTCLNNQIDEKTCDKLGLEEKIFSVLSVNKCKQELTNSSKDNECWPSSNCDTALTSKAILALERTTDTTTQENWLLSQNKSATGIDWFLQIESSEPSTCTISYSSFSYDISINEDKKINSGAGSCLRLSDNEYWLEVSSGCYDRDYEISCDKKFLTNLLFKNQDSPTIHISDETEQASAGGTTTAKVDSKCFKQGSSCDYEATLWGTFVLSNLGYEVSAYYPYLITLADDNEQYLPESFLYSLTSDSDYYTELISKQTLQGYWQESGDEYYDTALAMYSVQDKDFSERDLTLDWLEEKQGSEGCWDNSDVKNTAFILYSLWPNYFVGDDTGTSTDCEDVGYCVSKMTCSEAGGNELEDYSHTCSVGYVCCDEDKVPETCEELGGEICSNNQECVSGVSDKSAEDLGSGEVCCVQGFCQTSSPDDEGEDDSGSESLDCELYDGTCKTSCGENEEQDSDYSCDYSSEVCCFPEKSSSLWWIWVLIALIVLASLGIIFKDKLKEFWFKLKSNKKPKKPSPGFKPGPRPPQRRIIHPKHSPKPRRPQQQKKPSKELDEVLKKLKDMGK